MEVFRHHIYEYKKGLRNLILHTTKIEFKESIEQQLIKNKISYVIYHIGNGKINLFFGHESCVDVVQNFSSKNLNRLSDEEDFILGIMLGYDRIAQCNRYLTKKMKNKFVVALAG